MNMASPAPNTKVLHLFRSLLREATYLPDQAARTYIHEYTVQRFRSARTATPSRLRTAERSVRVLQQACNGKPSSLLRVLNLTYGRSGPQKRELVNRLRSLEVLASVPPVEVGLGAIVDANSEPNNKTTATDGKSSTVAASKTSSLPQVPFDVFIRSQRRRQARGLFNKPMKYLIPRIPDTNIWGRPLPIKRRENIEKTFVASTLQRLNPPNPEWQWHRLRNLIMGNIPFEQPPKRRPGRSNPPPELCFSEPARHVHKKGYQYGHHITPRYMRRMWASVWASCALMKPDDSGMEWQVTWGGDRHPLTRGKLPIEHNLSMFR